MNGYAFEHLANAGLGCNSSDHSSGKIHLTQASRKAQASKTHGSSGFRIAEDQQLGRAHFHAGLFRPAVIDESEELYALGLQDPLQLFHGRPTD
jgi:hypothetical protein